MGIDILGIDIVGVDILGIDIPAPTRYYNASLNYVMITPIPFHLIKIPYFN